MGWVCVQCLVPLDILRYRYVSNFRHVSACIPVCLIKLDTKHKPDVEWLWTYMEAELGIPSRDNFFTFFLNWCTRIESAHTPALDVEIRGVRLGWALHYSLHTTDSESTVLKLESAA